MTYEETCAKLKEHYDGYHFVENTIGIYNPFSLLNTFKYNKFSNYWFETGTPSYLVELVEAKPITIWNAWQTKKPARMY